MKKKRILILILIIFFIITFFTVTTFANDYKEVKNEVTFFPILTVIISIFFVILGKLDSTNNILKFEKNKMYYPPNAESPILLEYILKEKITKKGAVSALLYFANKGYIKIEEYYETADDSNIGQLQIKTKKMKIIKLKEYKGKSKIDKMFLEILFNTSNEIELDDAKGRSKLNQSIEKLYEKMDDKRNDAVMYKKNIGKNVINLYCMIFIILGLMVIDSLAINNMLACIVLILGLSVLLLSVRLLNSIIIGEDFIKEEERILLFVLVCFLIIIIFWRIFCSNL